MSNLTGLFILLALTAYSGMSCSDDASRFELREGPAGSVYRLDKKTGNVVLILGDEMREIADKSLASLSEEDLAKLALPKKWPSQSLDWAGHPELTVSLTTRLNGTRVLAKMRLVAEPIIDPSLRSYGNAIGFELRDQHGFSLAQESKHLDSWQRITGGTPGSTRELVYECEVGITPLEYSSVTRAVFSAAFRAE